MSEQEIDVCDPQPPAADGDEGTSVPLASGWDVSGHFTLCKYMTLSSVQPGPRGSISNDSLLPQGTVY